MRKLIKNRSIFCEKIVILTKFSDSGTFWMILIDFILKLYYDVVVERARPAGGAPYPLGRANIK